MDNNAVEVINLTKKFKRATYRASSLKTQFVEWAKSGFKKNKRATITVLDGISFNIKSGHTFGIMGVNGAGKSTLLKLICGIISPTSGYVKTQGVITPLLELGAGFNQELTAKENILINGLILGMSKKLIQSKYDEILDFAELKEVANEPIRTFSSGMYIRLAFSIAININPDIIILDEIMGVGDAYFQQKSKEKLMDFKRKGKTIILVSHNPEDVAKVCDEALFLSHGKIAEIGDPDKVAGRYKAECGVKTAV